MYKEKLIQLAMDDHRVKFPSIPDHCRAVTKYSDKTANGLTRMIKDYINLLGGQAERISTTGQYREGKTYNDVVGRARVMKGSWIPGTSTKGSADISALYKGLTVKIEIKVGKDRQSEAQKEYQQRIERAGGIYMIARDFESWSDEFEELIKERK